jgi:hypothetical protein
MKRGQVWVETAVYTLIAFVMIGLVLAYAKPKIEASQDKAIIEQSIAMMEDVNLLIISLIQGGAGNKRAIELGITKGIMNIDGVNDQIVFEMDSKHLFSQPGEAVKYGSMIVTTEEKGNINVVTLMLNYSGLYNITFNENDELRPLPKAAIPYNLFISNKGKSKMNTSETCVTTSTCDEIAGYYVLDCNVNCKYSSEKTTISFETKNE